MNAVVQANQMGNLGQVSGRFAVSTGNDLAEGVSGGYGLIGYRGKVWSIRHKGNEQQLMRDDGDGPRGSIDVVVIKANKHLSKNWYENGFVEGSNAPPDCSSANGVVPDAGVPKKQANVCATCPKNAWGSATGGSGKGKACGDHRRMAVVPLLDLKNEYFGGALLLRCPAASLQDLASFSSKLEAMGYPYYAVGMKIGFDPQESFPKFTFTAIRALTDPEADIIMAHQKSVEVQRVIADDPVDPAVLAAAQAQVIAPQAQVDPQVGSLAARGPAPSASQVDPPTAPAPVTAGGFGPTTAQPAATQPVTQQVTHTPAPAQTATTGFGPTAGSPNTAAPSANQPVAMTGFGPAPTAQSPVSNGSDAAAQQSFSGAMDGTKSVDNAAQDAFVNDLDAQLASLLNASPAPTGPTS